MGSDPPYPDAYLTCKVCRTAGGLPCFALSGMVVAGRPDRAPVTLPAPHTTRKVSARWRATA